MKRGRPPLPPEDRLSEVLPFRCTKEEADRIHKRALREGLSVNALLRQHLTQLISVSKQSS